MAQIVPLAPAHGTGPEMAARKRAWCGGWAPCATSKEFTDAVILAMKETTIARS